MLSIYIIIITDIISHVEQMMRLKVVSGMSKRYE